MSGRFEGRTALVTGGASGIGRATAMAFAREGASVVVADLDESGGAETVRAIEQAAGTGAFVQTDVTSAEAVDAMVRETIERFGRLDFAHNNVGISDPRAPLAEIELAQWQRMIAVNLSSVFLGMKYELPALLERGSGAIVNTSSGAGVFGSPGIAAYTAAKHGVVGLTRAAAADYQGTGVRVNAVCPGVMDTPMYRRALASGDPPRTSEVLGRPQDVAEAVLWLCSDDAASVNGQALLVYGRFGAHERRAVHTRWTPLDEVVGS